MKLFNHTYTIAFTVPSNDSEAEDVTPTMLKTGLLERIKDLDICGEWEEAVGLPDVTP